jgi:DNA-directed RNA polymerase specialized sigma24 family protein
MSLGNQIAANLPYLRRYARALTGSQNAGDAFVRAMLEAVVADAALMASLDGGRVPLYRAFTRVWSSAQLADAPTAGASTSEHEAGAQLRLGAITPPARQALLLTTLEDFTTAQAAEILGLDTAAVAALVAEAVAEIEAEQKTSVLIIEDEPLIAMQLEDLVSGLGHAIYGTAGRYPAGRRFIGPRCGRRYSGRG